MKMAAGRDVSKTELHPSSFSDRHEGGQCFSFICLHLDNGGVCSGRKVHLADSGSGCERLCWSPGPKTEWKPLEDGGCWC